MPEVAENPYVAAAVDLDRPIESSVPLSTYGYALVPFFLGAFAGGFVFIWPLALAGFDPSVAFAIAAVLSLPVGLFTGLRMYQRLADIHRRKVAWEVEQAERLSDFS